MRRNVSMFVVVLMGLEAADLGGIGSDLHAAAAVIGSRERFGGRHAGTMSK